VHAGDVKKGTKSLASSPLAKPCSIREQDLITVIKQKTYAMKQLSPTRHRGGHCIQFGAVKAKADPDPKYDGWSFISS